VSTFLRQFALCLASALIAGCADTQGTRESADADPVLTARTQLIGSLDTCNEAYGYNPSSAAAVAENELAFGELAWRQCAYGALRAYNNPDPEVRRQIEALIVEDIAMTAAVQQGTMTRSQRKARNLTQIEAIKALEEGQARAATTAQAQHDAQVRQVVNGLRGFAN